MEVPASAGRIYDKYCEVLLHYEIASTERIRTAVTSVSRLNLYKAKRIYITL
jgi:hypothetical protein